MRIKSITPIRVTPAELLRRQTRYADLAPPPLTIEVVNLPDGDGVPRRLETPADIEASDRLVAEEIHRTDPAEHDAVMPDCVLDPGVLTAEEDAPVPVHGILRTSASFLSSLGESYAAVTRNAPIGDELAACISRYGLGLRFTGVAVLDLSFEDIEDDVTWNAAIDRVRDQFAGAGVRTLLNGCSAVDVHPREDGTAVVDPTRLALELLGVAAGSGLGQRATSTAR
jgi:Asp/Glu/hydantoin racemase